MYTVNWNCSKNKQKKNDKKNNVYVIGEYLLVVFAFWFGFGSFKEPRLFFDTFHYRVLCPYVTDFCESRGHD